MTDVPEIIAWTVAGLALGAVYFFLVARSVDILVSDRPRRSAVGYLALRLGSAVSVLALAATRGAAELIGVLLGFLIARSVAIARARRNDHGN